MTLVIHRLISNLCHYIGKRWNGAAVLGVPADQISPPCLHIRRTLGSGISQVKLMQQEEDSKLQEALAAVAEGKLPVRVSQSTSRDSSSSLQFGGQERRRRPKHI